VYKFRDGFLTIDLVCRSGVRLFCVGFSVEVVALIKFGSWFVVLLFNFTGKALELLVLVIVVVCLLLVSSCSLYVNLGL
jgi:hypothetical protein